MTQEEKARAYDEALERAKSFQQKFGGDYAGYIFPELRESEEKAADKYIRNIVDAAGHPGWDWTTQDISEAFIAGAKWQKEQMPKNSEKPKEWSDEQMLKEAVEGRISACGLHNAIFIKEPEWTEMLDKYEEGDKVRVIVLPKEDQTNG